MMRYIIYKITNLINNRYYIGRHAAKNIDDGYMGSGIGIKNAISKYGRKNFKKEILAEATSQEELWKLEEQYVTKEVVDDPLSYNQVGGGKSYLNGLKQSDPEKFFEHQRKAATRLAELTVHCRTKEWHAKGGAASRKIINARNKYRLVTNEGEELFLDGNTFKQVCKERGWNYNTLSWSIALGKRRPIQKGPLTGFYVERLA